MQITMKNPSTQLAEVEEMLEDLGVLREMQRGISNFKGLPNIHEGPDIPDGGDAMTGLCIETAGAAVVAINGVDSNFEEVVSMLKEAMVEELA
ncbi:hypothetical protein ACOSP7_026810 [Xanthoceras sorbifolium]